MPGETCKAHERRLSTEWYDEFCGRLATGIDIGSGPDPIHPDSPTWRRWDKEDGDAQEMAGVENESYDAVYASHIIEHLPDPVRAIRNWWRIVKPGGCLIILAPHRDLYEKKDRLPSNWNHEHCWFYLPDRSEPPVTRNLFRDIAEAIPWDERSTGGNPGIRISILNDGWIPLPVDVHSQGEYSIEAIIRKAKHL